MEGKNKTFGELDIFDKIYFYPEHPFSGPGDIREFTIQESPVKSSVGVVYININIAIPDTCPFWIEAEFSIEDTEETINLNDYNTNYLIYGDEYWFFSTNLNTLIDNRRKKNRKNDRK